MYARTHVDTAKRNQTTLGGLGAQFDARRFLSKLTLWLCLSLLVKVAVLQQTDAAKVDAN
jgi:hypothetical protein